MFRISFKIEVGSWELGDGSWELGVGRSKFEICNLNSIKKAQNITNYLKRSLTYSE